ncbi:TetR/AcrR family transcriptional regulator [Pendulispora rubella]|uniref:TetR/AcrR family transcriptional regulator n=1 Tax=Pendulispora rubella TaxID=2741070 RepID=A0ABZ2KQ56_9BACT
MAKKLSVTPRKQALQARSRETVDVILEATARILVKEGYDRTSTNKIARAAGVSIGSLYQYFPGKEALVAAVITKHTDELLELIAGTALRVAQLPLAVATRELVRVMIEAHAIAPKLHRVLTEQTPRVGRLAYMEKIDDEAIRLVRAYLEMHRDELCVEDLDLASFMAVTTVEALTHAAVLRQPELLAQPHFVDEVTTMVLRYLSLPDGKPRKRARLSA